MKNKLLWLLLLSGSWFFLPPSLSGGALAYADPLSESKEYFKKGEKFFQQGHYEKAIDAYRKAYQLQPSTKLLLLNIAQCYRLAKKPNQARVFYEEYLAAEPKSPYKQEVKSYLADLEKLLRKRRKPKGVSPEDLAASKKYFSEAERSFKKGEKSLDKRDFEEAARAYSSAYILYPASLLLYNIALSNHRAGDHELAKDYFERFLARTATGANDKKTRETREKAEKYLTLVMEARTDDILRQMALNTPQDPIDTPVRRSKSWVFLAVGALSLGAATTLLVSSNSFDRNLDFSVTLP